MGPSVHSFLKLATNKSGNTSYASYLNHFEHSTQTSMHGIVFVVLWEGGVPVSVQSLVSESVASYFLFHYFFLNHTWPVDDDLQNVFFDVRSFVYLQQGLFQQQRQFSKGAWVLLV